MVSVRTLSLQCALLTLVLVWPEKPFITGRTFYNVPDQPRPAWVFVRTQLPEPYRVPYLLRPTTPLNLDSTEFATEPEADAAAPCHNISVIPQIRDRPMSDSDPKRIFNCREQFSVVYLRIQVMSPEMSWFSVLCESGEGPDVLLSIRHWERAARLRALIVERRRDMRAAVHGVNAGARSDTSATAGPCAFLVRPPVVAPAPVVRRALACCEQSLGLPLKDNKLRSSPSPVGASARSRPARARVTDRHPRRGKEGT
eukprot:g57201.t1